jgi:polyisoprenoid-binding protein YceI
MMITNINGSFGQFSATAETEGDDFSTASFNFSAAIKSINTGVADRDAHLISDDFFNAEVFPELIFKSTEITKKDDKNYVISGDLTIRDLTKHIDLTTEFAGIVVDPYGQIKAGLTINGKINRSDFGLKWNAITEAGSIVVSDEIKLTGEVQLIKQS